MEAHLWNILIQFKGGSNSLSYTLPLPCIPLLFISASVESLCPAVNFIPHHPVLYFHVYRSHEILDNSKRYLEYHGKAAVRNLEMCCQGFKDATSPKKPLTCLSTSLVMKVVFMLCQGSMILTAVTTECQKVDSNDILPGVSFYFLGFKKCKSIVWPCII